MVSLHEGALPIKLYVRLPECKPPVSTIEPFGPWSIAASTDNGVNSSVQSGINSFLSASETQTGHWPSRRAAMASSEASSASEHVKERPSRLRRLFPRRPSAEPQNEKQSSHPRWSFGILNDRETVEVPGMFHKLNANYSIIVSQRTGRLTLSPQALCYCLLPIATSPWA